MQGMTRYLSKLKMQSSNRLDHHLSPLKFGLFNEGIRVLQHKNSHQHTHIKYLFCCSAHTNS